MLRTARLRALALRALALRALALLALAVLVAGSCATDDDSASTDAAPDTTAAETATETHGDAEAPDFAEHGPYPVGVVDLDLDGQPIAVFYPAAEVPDGAEPYTYSGEEIFGPELAAVLPGAFGEDQPVDAHVGLPASEEGPFPVVLHSHGFGGFYRFSGRHNAHTASWGFVVAAVDHPGRNLLAQLGLGPAEPARSDVEDLLATLDLLEEASAAPGGPLEGLVDAANVATEGHSAGGRAAALAAEDPRIATWIGQAPAPPLEGDLRELVRRGEAELPDLLAEQEPPDKPSMVIAAELDVAIQIGSLEEIYAWLPAPKRLVVMAAAGHNAFTDVCKPIQEEGGLAQLAEDFGLTGDAAQLITLGEDGCTEDSPPAEDGFALFDHLTVAQLRWVFDLDRPAAAAALSTSVLEERFPGMVAANQAED